MDAYAGNYLDGNKFKLKHMNLVKELRKIAQLNAENALAQSNSILDADSEKDMQMLQYFGRYSEVQKAESQKQMHQQIISGNFVTLTDIRKVCFKYALRYTNAEHYKKTIPAHALNDLRKFKECNKAFSADKLKMIAPASHFHTVDAPKKDPVLVYEHSNNRTEIISTWGNDFSWTRRIIGILTLYWHWVASLIAICAMFYTVQFSPFGIIFIMVPVCSFLGSYHFYTDGSISHIFSVKWNTNTK